MIHVWKTKGNFSISRKRQIFHESQVLSSHLSQVWVKVKLSLLSVSVKQVPSPQICESSHIMWLKSSTSGVELFLSFLLFVFSPLLLFLQESATTGVYWVIFQFWVNYSFKKPGRAYLKLFLATVFPRCGATGPVLHWSAATSVSGGQWSNPLTESRYWNKHRGKKKNDQAQKEKKKRCIEKHRGVKGEAEREAVTEWASQWGGERVVPTERWLLSEFIWAVASQVNPLNGSK